MSNHRADLVEETAGSYPRPQLVRSAWADLCGTWAFAFDDAGQGQLCGWHRGEALADTITVPFPPESPASGVNDPSPHPLLWYQRRIGRAELEAAGHAPGRRLMLRFGAVDYRCEVWLDGGLVGTHEGGHTPFSIDITDAIEAGDSHVLAVRVHDDPDDVAQPRGKQDWQSSPHSIWYHRTSGIWQPVWLESVPEIAIEHLRWTTDVAAGRVELRLTLSARPTSAIPIRVWLKTDGRTLAEVSTSTDRPAVELTLTLPDLANGQAIEELLWTPDNPRLIDAAVEAGEDTVMSYLGLRTVHVERGAFLLNDRPAYLRSVLSQGYWPESHLAAPSADALRREAELIKELGFNAARVHQKFEDPRFLYWADRLGILVWAEAPAALEFSPAAIERTVHEWLEVVRRDQSHPCVVAWVPLNESWGVQHISHDTRMQHYARALVELTKALDPTRPVVSNDGWEQVDTDIVAIHDYTSDPEELRRRYSERAAVDALIETVGPAGRTLILSGDVGPAPVMLTEFGGISYDVSAHDSSWGYAVAADADDFAGRLSALFAAVHSSRALAGFCYTQLADTAQETNGLLTEARTAKLPVEVTRRIVTGDRA